MISPSPLTKKWQNATLPIVALTAYSYPFARLLDEAGVDMILVGDSLGMVEHGRPDTTEVTLEEMVFHTRSVRRGVSEALLVADMPFGSYESPEQALKTASELRSAGADAVKLEGGREKETVISALVSEGFELMGHLGMLPQKIREEGRYRIKGKTETEKQGLFADAQMLQEKGAFAMVLELVTPPVAEELTNSLSIPTIGIGSGNQCRGQILVSYDLFGLTPWFKPGFVQPTAHIGETIKTSVRDFCQTIRSRSF